MKNFLSRVVREHIGPTLLRGVIGEVSPPPEEEGWHDTVYRNISLAYCFFPDLLLAVAVSTPEELVEASNEWLTEAQAAGAIEASKMLIPDVFSGLADMPAFNARTVHIPERKRLKQYPGVVSPDGPVRIEEYAFRLLEYLSRKPGASPGSGRSEAAIGIIADIRAHNKWLESQ